MLTDNAKWRLLFKIFSLLCIAAILVCLICDMGVNRQIRLTWSLYVLSAVPFVWLVAVPSLMLNRHKLCMSLAAFTLALLPFLYLTARVSKGEWFAPLGVPVSIISLLALWATWLLIKFLKVNRWFMAAILVFIYGVITNAFVHAFVNAFVNSRLFGVSDIISLLACIAVTVLLCVIGYGDKNENTRLVDAQPYESMPEEAASEENKPETAPPEDALQGESEPEEVAP